MEKEQLDLKLKYLGKLNKDILSELGMYIHAQGVHLGNFLEAAILEAAFVEFMLRALIFKKIAKKKNFADQFGSKYWDGDAKFSQLIDYYELLGGKTKTAQKLRQYNTLRNCIVHKLLEYNSIKKILMDAKSCYKHGIIIESELRVEAGFPALKDLGKVKKL